MLSRHARRPRNRESPGDGAGAGVWRAVPKGWRVDVSSQSVAHDFLPLPARKTATGAPQQLQRLIEASALQPLAMQGHRAHHIGLLPQRAYRRDQVPRQGRRQMAMPAVLETHERLGHRTAVGQRCLCPKKRKRPAEAAATQLARGFERHGTARTARSQRNQREFALRAEGNPLPNQSTAGGTAGWPKHRQDDIDKHTVLSSAT